ncbi:hypothetical protein FHS51_003412 [Sphingobium wenxiniae]|uniref:Relaxase/mobilization nuclease-like protein n=1 Tax=Sphingobium wenxiniae (strain DSM 21828 / CGMCC 1.7748 / JZ-1) TaxID=595605 RepID=A0A562K876_SPHWJ|nr:relaxase/mobilization nuclease domain-containing protein [Sphingobium wenxiniae]MBB6193156.1 hypothetical protein [Sphingobium wenxiniae]TWH91602.1 relaxase/mobilization nuclease-like protein [Sphingobium wenxiniae]
MSPAFIFSETTLDRLERVQGARSGGRGRVDNEGHRRLGNALLGVIQTLGLPQSRGSARSADVRTAAASQQLDRTARRVPQVMVKITSRLHGSASTVGCFTYVARLGMEGKDAVPLVTSEGRELTSAVEMLELARAWEEWEQTGDDRRKGATAIVMVYSMPPGTDAEKVYGAVRDLAETDFSNRRWVAGLHTDEAHPHVHLIIAARDLDGRRFNPDRAFLQHNRERFAELLRARGIEADATIRMTRAYPPKHDKLPVQKMRERGEALRVDVSRAAVLEGKWEPDQAFMRARESQVSRTAENIALVKSTYLKAIAELSDHGGDEQQRLARSLQLFVDQIREPTPARSEIIERLKEGRALPEHFEQDPALEKLKARVRARAGDKDMPGREGKADSPANRLARLRATTKQLRDQTGQLARAREGDRFDKLAQATAKLKQQSAGRGQAASGEPAKPGQESARTPPANWAQNLEKRLEEAIKEKDRERLRQKERDRDRDRDRDGDKGGPRR